MFDCRHSTSRGLPVHHRVTGSGPHSGMGTRHQASSSDARLPESPARSVAVCSCVPQPRFTSQANTQNATKRPASKATAAQSPTDDPLLNRPKLRYLRILMPYVSHRSAPRDDRASYSSARRSDTPLRRVLRAVRSATRPACRGSHERPGRTSVAWSSSLPVIVGTTRAAPPPIRLILRTAWSVDDALAGNVLPFATDTADWRR